jgi:hypothetical protein
MRGDTEKQTVLAFYLKKPTDINNSFRRVRAKVNHDEEIFSFIWNKFQR